MINLYKKSEKNLIKGWKHIIKTMKQEFSMKWDEQDDRIATIERQIKDLQTTTPQQHNPLHDHERCIIIRGVHYESGEDLPLKIT